MEIVKKTLSSSPHPGNLSGGNGAAYSVQLLEKARADIDTVLKELGSQLGGLSEAGADARLKQVGMNEIAQEKHQSAVMRLLANIKNPLVLLLLALGVLSYHLHFRDHHRGRRRANGFAPGEHARVCPAPATVLAVSGHHAAGLCDSDTGGENLVYSQVWRINQKRYLDADGVHSGLNLRMTSFLPSSAASRRIAKGMSASQTPGGIGAVEKTSFPRGW